jgi:hypothetical protein
MHNEPAVAVKTAKKICSALSRLFFKGHHMAIEGVHMVFAGFDAMEAVAELGRDAIGKLYLVPHFELIDGEVTLQKVLVADGITYPGTIVHTICDPVLFLNGGFGLLSDVKGKTIEFRCLNETQLMRRAVRRPQNAAKLIERGRRALAEGVAPLPALAA